MSQSNQVKNTNEKSTTTTSHLSIDTDDTAEKSDQLEQAILEWFKKESELLSIKEHLGKDDFGDTAILMYENQDAFNHARNLRLKLKISEEQLRIKTKQCNTLAEQKNHLFDILQTSDQQYTEKEGDLQERLQKLEELNEILSNENYILQDKFDELKSVAGKYQKRFSSALTSENKYSKKVLETCHNKSSSPKQINNGTPKENNRSPNSTRACSPKQINSSNIEELNFKMFEEAICRSLENSPKEESACRLRGGTYSPKDSEQSFRSRESEYNNSKGGESSELEDDESNDEEMDSRERINSYNSNESKVNTTSEKEFNDTLTEERQFVSRQEAKHPKIRNTQTQTVPRRLSGFTAEIHRKMFQVRAMSLRNDQHINTIISECQRVFVDNSKTLDLLYKENQEVSGKLEVWVENYMLLKRQQEEGGEMYQRELKRSWNTEKEYRDQLKELCETVNSLTEEACEEKRSLEKYKLSLESVYLTIQKMDRQIEFVQQLANEKASINEGRLGNLALKCEQLHHREEGKRRKSVSTGSRKISKSIFKMKRRLSESNESFHAAAPL